MGSEMCIRDSLLGGGPRPMGSSATRKSGAKRKKQKQKKRKGRRKR